MRVPLNRNVVLTMDISRGPVVRASAKENGKTSLYSSASKGATRSLTIREKSGPRQASPCRNDLEAIHCLTRDRD